MVARIQNVTAVLLAGGKSRRMGRDKRFLDLGGRPLLLRVLDVLEGLFSEILLVVAEPIPELLGLSHRVVADLIPDRAALGGLYTGLSYATLPRIFAFGCDMPFLSRAVIARMVELDPEADVVMARLATGLQPLHAIYSKACLPHLERMATAQQLTVQDLAQAPGLSVRVVQERDVRDLDPRFISFLNINTPADLEFARKLIAESDIHAGSTDGPPATQDPLRRPSRLGRRRAPCQASLADPQVEFSGPCLGARRGQTGRDIASQVRGGRHPVLP